VVPLSHRWLPKPLGGGGTFLVSELHFASVGENEGLFFGSLVDRVRRAVELGLAPAGSICVIQDVLLQILRRNYLLRARMVELVELLRNLFLGVNVFRQLRFGLVHEQNFQILLLIILVLLHEILDVDIQVIQVLVVHRGSWVRRG
jgi:hypothetical protein